MLLYRLAHQTAERNSDDPCQRRPRRSHEKLARFPGRSSCEQGGFFLPIGMLRVSFPRYVLISGSGTGD